MSWVEDRIEDFSDSLAVVGEGITNIIEGVTSDPKKLAGLAISIAFPGAAAWIGSQLGLSGVAATIVGNTALGTISNGGNVGEALKGAVIGAGAQGLSSELKAQFGPTQDAISVLGGTEAIDNAAYNIEKTLTDFAAKATTDVALATIMQKDPVATLVFSGAQAASGLIINQALENADLKDSYNKLPSAAKDSITAAITASLTGKDIGKAVAGTLVNGAIRTFRNGVALQDAAVSQGGTPFTTNEITSLASTQNLTPDEAPSFLTAITEAKNIAHGDLPANFADTLTKQIPSLGDVKVSDDQLIKALAQSQYDQNIAAVSPEAAQYMPSYSDIYQQWQEYYDSLNKVKGTQLASSDNDDALKVIEDLRKSGLTEDQDAVSSLGESSKPVEDQDAVKILGESGKPVEEKKEEPFQGPMGPMTEDKIKRYNDEFAKYLDYLQAGQPNTPDYGPGPVGMTGDNWDEFDKNLKTMMDEGKLPSQWQEDSEGNFTYIADDGSTLTIGPDGQVIHYTDAPKGDLPGETPAPAPSPAPPPPAPAPPPKVTTPAPPAPAPPAPSPSPAPAAQSGLDVNALMALLASMGGTPAPAPAPQVEYSKMPEFDVTKAFSPTLYAEREKAVNPYLRGLTEEDQNG